MIFIKSLNDIGIAFTHVKKIFFLKKLFKTFVPSHVARSSANLNPSLHEQLKEPIVLLHLCWHPPFEITPPIVFSHSLISEIKKFAGFKRNQVSKILLQKFPIKRQFKIWNNLKWIRDLHASKFRTTKGTLMETHIME